MRGVCKICLVILFTLTVTSCFGENCKCEDGRYQAAYSKLDGTCESFVFYPIPIDYRYSQLGEWHLDELYYNNTVMTDISYQGCVLAIKQALKHNETVLFTVEGEFEVEKETRLSGTVLRTEYHDDQTIKCQGTYDVVLNKTGELVVSN
ncbi:MAG: hypothetical protein JXA30_09410 [Deltaproteobacteria bacterium]|nr:hypothetical protein [Deltaproteobacteria bacterium]